MTGGEDIPNSHNQYSGKLFSQQRLMYYFFLLGFFAIFSTTISKNPVLPLFTQALGSSDAVIGLIAAISPIAGILFSFPVGVLSDHVGRKRLLISSGAIFFIAPLLYLFIVHPLWLIPLRFFHGMATAILGPVIAAAIVERFPATKGEMLGQYSSATLVGRMLAPAVGGLVLTYFAAANGLIAYQVVYLIAALAGAPVFILTLWYPDDQNHHRSIISMTSFKESFRVFFSNPRLRATASADMATYFAYGAFETFLPVFLIGKGINPYQIGIIFSAQVVLIAVTKPFFGRLSDRIDKRIQIIAGLLVLGGSVAAIPHSSTFFEFLALSMVTGFGISLSTIATSAYIADVAQRQQVGASMGALSSTMDVGHSLGPLITGIIITEMNFSAGFLMSSILIIIVTGFFAWSVKEQ
ncbi:MAG: MFS transporter [Methanomicrobiales archaeon]|nr:MFS transporter [Methanomicrobiales archaeon]